MVELDPPMRRALASGDADLGAMLSLERWVYQNAAHLLASGPAIVEEVESVYGIRLDRARCAFVLHGLNDEVAQMAGSLDGPAGSMSSSSDGWRLARASTPSWTPSPFDPAVSRRGLCHRG
jgi:hypothetical protein